MYYYMITFLKIISSSHSLIIDTNIKLLVVNIPPIEKYHGQ